MKIPIGGLLALYLIDILSVEPAVITDFDQILYMKNTSSIADFVDERTIYQLDDKSHADEHVCSGRLVNIFVYPEFNRLYWEPTV